MKKSRSQWTEAECTVLVDMIHAHMAQYGYADFEQISHHVNHNSRACYHKANSLGVLYNSKSINTQAKDNKPKHDMVKLPRHKNLMHVDYWIGEPNPVRVDYPLVWETLRRNKS